MARKQVGTTWHAWVPVIGALVLAGACGGTSTGVAGPTSGASATTTADPTTSAATTAPTTTFASTSTSELVTTIPTTTVAPTTTTILGDPPPIRTEGAVGNEGDWKVAARLANGPVIWTTAVRPIVGNRSILWYVALFDQTRLHAALFNVGKPPSGAWVNGSKVPAVVAPALVAAFNSGFMLRHIKGGYFTEGQELKPLKDGQMTVGIRPDGRMVIGVYGTDLVNDGTWTSLRQNLPPVVRDGVSVINENPRAYWGDQRGQTEVFRSALCTVSDGRMMYVATREVKIEPFAQGLVAIGCQLAMQLDVNFNHVWFSTFEQVDGGKQRARGLDPWTLYADRVLRFTAMDFFALFDPATLPDGVVA